MKKLITIVALLFFSIGLAQKVDLLDYDEFPIELSIDKKDVEKHLHKVTGEGFYLRYIEPIKVDGKLYQQQCYWELFNFKDFEKLTSDKWIKT